MKARTVALLALSITLHWSGATPTGTSHSLPLPSHSTPSATGPVACLPFNPSAAVDIADIVHVTAHWGQIMTDLDWDPTFDLDGDGDTDVLDISLAAEAWLSLCVPLDPGQIAPPIRSTSLFKLLGQAGKVACGPGPRAIRRLGGS
jgi:hypothetical protein